MNKTYKRPEIYMRELPAQTMIATSIAVNSDVSASSTYEGGGDAKDRGLLNVLSTDNSSSEEEEW